MNDFKLPIWRQNLKASQSKEGRLISNRWIQLANISKNNQPRVRTVVFRGWIGPSTMLIYTDKRSEKFKDLEINNDIEILWLFFKSKTQYRFKGKSYKVDNDKYYWENLPKKSKIPWYWPAPGEEIDKKKNFTISNDILSKPSNFSVLQIEISEVDLLKLEKPVHKRYVWKSNNNWKTLEVYP